LSKKIRIGSRGSDLALWQAHYFQDQMSSIGVETEIIIITTKGDRIQHLSFDKIEGKGFFTKEIEDALLNDEIDVAIHSHKDLETQMPPGLQIAGVSYREDPSELLLIRKECVDASLPLNFKKGAIIGTSSARRKGQVTSLRPDVTIKDIRGNVPTRINKLRSGDFDAILLAFAGVHRLGLDLSDLHAERLDPKLFVPAPAQGVLAFQCRAEDDETAAIIRKIHDPAIAEEIDIERSILSGFGGGCHIPIGAHVTRKEDHFDVRVSFADAWENVNRRVRFSAHDKAEALNRFDNLKADTALPKSVFISRELDPSSYLKRLCDDHAIHLEAEALIETSPVAFTANPDQVDWVFFSSSNAVRHFFEQVDLAQWEGHRFGALGTGTAQTLATYVSEISFIGQGGDTEAVAKAFGEALGSSQALIPSSDKTLRTIPRALKPEQNQVITCYTTQSKHRSIAAKEAYIFTSPSNVTAFFDSGNSLPSSAIVIAIGVSTASELHHHHQAVRVGDIPHEAELLALMTR
jgi:hydroxymethylbilane synthase